MKKKSITLLVLCGLLASLLTESVMVVEAKWQPNLFYEDWAGSKAMELAKDNWERTDVPVVDGSDGEIYIVGRPGKLYGSDYRGYNKPAKKVYTVFCEVEHYTLLWQYYVPFTYNVLNGKLSYGKKDETVHPLLPPYMEKGYNRANKEREDDDEATYKMEYAWKAVNFEDITVYKKTKVHFSIDALPKYELDLVVFHHGKQMKHVSLGDIPEGTITLPKGEYKLFLDAPKKEKDFILTLNFKGKYRLSGYQGNRH